MYVNKKKTLKINKPLFQCVFFFQIFDMPRNPQNVLEHAIVMLNAGMTMNAVAMNNACSIPAIRHIRQRFQATGCTEDRPRSRRPSVTKLGQGRYIRNKDLRNRYQTATAPAANTPGTHSNRIFLLTKSVTNE